MINLFLIKKVRFILVAQINWWYLSFKRFNRARFSSLRQFGLKWLNISIFYFQVRVRPLLNWLVPKAKMSSTLETTSLVTFSSRNVKWAGRLSWSCPSYLTRFTFGRRKILSSSASPNWIMNLQINTSELNFPIQCDS